MKMAKATKEDIAMMQRFFDTLENHIDNGDDTASDQALARYVRTAIRGHLASARNRVILGCDLLIDTVCDPDKTYLDYSPSLKQLIPETTTEDGERLFYIISYRYSRRGALTFWRPKAAGYTTNLLQAGKYTESQVLASLDYYHQGENAVAISVEELHAKFPVAQRVDLNPAEKAKHLERAKEKVLDLLKPTTPL